MKLQYETIGYEIEEALVYLKRLFKEVKNKTLMDGEFLPEMEHILWHLNFSFNARYLSRKEVNNLSREKSRNYTFPPKEIFGRPKDHPNKYVSTQANKGGRINANSGDKRKFRRKFREK